MNGTFRQSMSWLHTWSGLVAGWLLFFVFVTGSATYFKDDITRWMKPEMPLPVHAQHPPATMMAELALDYLGRQPEAAHTWEILLPADGRRVGCGPGCGRPLRDYPSELTVSWAGNTERLDSTTGRPLPPLPATRDTEGGDLLDEMHYSLHYMSEETGRIIVAIGTMVAFLAILTGIVVHKKIFKDFFTFRPGKGQRSWLDAHNVFGVMALPFFLMITYSGMVEIGYMPAPLLQAPAIVRAPAGEHAPVLRPAIPMAAVIARSEAVLGVGEIGEIELSHPQGQEPRITVSRRWGTEYPFAGREGSFLSFSAVTGEPLDVEYTFGQPLPHKALWWLVGAHFAWFAGAGLRWLFFCCGLLGCAMIATGQVLWTVKRRERHERHGGNPIGLRLVERMNVGVLVGLPVGVAAYFWANRLLPPGLDGRAGWEAHCLFLTWGWVLLYAALRPVRRAWVETAGLAAAAFGAVPLLNLVTTDRHLGVTIAHGDWALAGVDLSMMALAALFGAIAWKLRRRWAAGGEPGEAAPGRRDAVAEVG
ncbi:PepSY-associated TM helix domain-containing protein [Thauera sinica]|uniref:PepSY-associated TM helix domain-containing protein n=1 Tax=Thauera sinica TaxID=2665146 RepID=A0ABW1AQ92_9RHOO|nr:PepSY-associated TM helix domain-containing protein [Thauera sp. K11]ATE59656.1 peptidase [Thauera sp. K11]